MGGLIGGPIGGLFLCTASNRCHTCKAQHSPPQTQVWIYHASGLTPGRVMPDQCACPACLPPGAWASVQALWQFALPMPSAQEVGGSWESNLVAPSPDRDGHLTTAHAPK